MLPDGRAPRGDGRPALLAQLVEHFHGKEGVNGSSPLEGLATQWLAVRPLGLPCDSPDCSLVVAASHRGCVMRSARRSRPAPRWAAMCGSHAAGPRGARFGGRNGPRPPEGSVRPVPAPPCRASRQPGWAVSSHPFDGDAANRDKTICVVLALDRGVPCERGVRCGLPGERSPTSAVSSCAAAKGSPTPAPHQHRVDTNDHNHDHQLAPRQSLSGRPPIFRRQCNTGRSLSTRPVQPAHAAREAHGWGGDPIARRRRLAIIGILVLSRG